MPLSYLTLLEEWSNEKIPSVCVRWEYPRNYIRLRYSRLAASTLTPPIISFTLLFLRQPHAMVWESVKRAGGGVASALCDAPMGRSDDEGGKASCRVLCVTMYVCVCTYGLLDVAGACRNRYCHDYMQVHVMWPMPAVTVTSSLPRLHFRNLLGTRMEKSVPSKVTSK